MRSQPKELIIHARERGLLTANAGASSVRLRTGLLAVLVAWNFVTGGQAFASGWMDVVGQLLALPVLIWSTLCWPPRGFRGVSGAAVLLAVCIAATVALMQLPLPANVWAWGPARVALQADLDVVGITHWLPRWSLTPLASERALWKILPALATFAGAVSLPRTALRNLLLLIVGLGVASLLLGTLQMALPSLTRLNPAPQWAPMWNGFFSNPNHQALSWVLVVIVAATFSFGRSRARWRSAPARAWLLPAIGMLALACIPLTGSRAGVLFSLAAVPIAAAMQRTARSDGTRLSTSRGRAMVLVGLLALGLGGVLLIVMEPADSMRLSLVATTARLAWAHAPLGAGLGAFVPVFETGAPSALMQWEYINHAQNEFVQWALELGVAGLCCVVASIVILVRCYPGTWSGPGRRHADEVAIAAWLGCAVLMVDGLVEYPLRTPALMCVGALLAGAMVSERRNRDEEIDDVEDA